MSWAENIIFGLVAGILLLLIFKMFWKELKNRADAEAEAQAKKLYLKTFSHHGRFYTIEVQRVEYGVFLFNVALYINGEKIKSRNVNEYSILDLILEYRADAELKIENLAAYPEIEKKLVDKLKAYYDDAF